MKILHFTGTGRGWMAGVEEYIVIVEDDEEKEEEHCAPGFELSSSTSLMVDLPDSLPLDTTLIPQR